MAIASFRALRALVFGVALTVSRNAAADAVSCTQMHAEGQRQEKAGHLDDALLSFRGCASDTACPAPIRNECTRLYTAVEAKLPTIVFSVVDDEGNDVVDVRVSSASGVITDGLDGRPVAVDPGLHELRFERPTGEVVTKSIVVRQGEKDRIVSVRVPSADAVAAPQKPAAGLQKHEPAPLAEESGFRVPAGSWVSYGVGVAALGTWGTFALLGRSNENALVECSPRCRGELRDDYDTMKRHYLIADISLGIAGAAVVAGTIILLTMGRRSTEGADDAPTAGRSLAVAPVSVGRKGGLLMLEGRY